MNIIDATILGAIQGVTEFVPVSSSGHLILMRDLLGLPTTGLAFDAVLQLATAVAILVYFWDDLYGVARRLFASIQADSTEENTLLWALVLGTIPAAILGLLLEGYMETVFRDPLVVVCALLAGSVLMAGAEWYGQQNRKLSTARGVLVGLFQSLALVPGVSRAGATISGGLLAGLSREYATRFAFLLGFPILFGSGAKKLWDLAMVDGSSGITFALVVGSVTAFTVGIASIHLLLRYLRDNTLYVFVGYRVCVALAALLFLV